MIETLFTPLVTVLLEFGRDCTLTIIIPAPGNNSSIILQSDSMSTPRLEHCMVVLQRIIVIAAFGPKYAALSCNPFPCAAVNSPRQSAGNH